MRIRHGILTLASLALLAGAAQPLDAQGWGDRLKQKAKDKVKQRADQRTDEAVTKGVDKAENTIKCVVSDKYCIEKAKADGKNVVLTDNKGNAVVETAGATASGAPAAETGGATASGAPAAAPAPAKPGEGMWVNYDFVPGARTIFSEDFSKDNVGDFPKRFDLVQGNVEVSERAGVRYLRTSEAKVSITLPEVLPERFTLEFDMEGGYGTPQVVEFVDTPGHNFVDFRYRAVGDGHTGWGGILGGSVNATGDGGEVKTRSMRARVMADGRYVKIYIDGKRVANVPNANLGRSNKIVFAFNGRDHDPALITSIRVAAGGKKLYDALAEKGRVSTQGIFFDTGSDRIRPESTPTLKEIGAMLAEHADLKLTIEGHTDNVGDAKGNQDLSHRRAKAVAQYLVAKHGVEASRLTSTGFGDTKPIGKNDTPEGRQNNRRVELVKI